jgi:hypothetical protein
MTKNEPKGTMHSRGQCLVKKGRQQGFQDELCLLDNRKQGQECWPLLLQRVGEMEEKERERI